MKSRAASTSSPARLAEAAAPARRSWRRSPHVVPGRLPAHWPARRPADGRASSLRSTSRRHAGPAIAAHPSIERTSRPPPGKRIDWSHAHRLPGRQPHRGVARRRLLPAARPAAVAARAAQPRPRRRHGRRPPVRACGTRGSSPSTAPSSGSAPTTPSWAPGTPPRPGSGWSWPERLDAPGRRLRRAARVDRGAGAADRRGAPARPRGGGLASGRSGRPRWPRRSRGSRPAAAPAACSTCGRRSRPRPRTGDGPFTTDGVHFTDAGAEVVAGAFAAVIAELEAEDDGQARAATRRRHARTATG